MGLDEQETKKSPRKRAGKRAPFVWAGVVIALAGVGWGGYSVYRHDQYETLYNSGVSALGIQDYALAKTYFAAALQIQNDLLTEAAYQKASDLVTSRLSLTQARSALSEGRLTTALSLLENVVPGDAADYGVAQGLKQHIANLLLVDKTMNDLNTWLDADQSVATALNDIASTEASLRSDSSESAFQSDESNLSSDISAESAATSSLLSASRSFNTDGQLISDSNIQSVIGGIEQSMNIEEDDTSSMCSDASTNLLEAQQDVQNWSKYGFGSGYYEEDVPNWNTDMTSLEDQANLINGDMGKLKAYATSEKTQIGLPTQSS